MKCSKGHNKLKYNWILITFLFVLIIDPSFQVKIHSSFNLNFEIKKKKDKSTFTTNEGEGDASPNQAQLSQTAEGTQAAQTNNTQPEEDPAKGDEKLLFAKWIHYIKYLELTAYPPQKFFRNPSFEAQVKNENFEKTSKEVKIKK